MSIDNPAVGRADPRAAVRGLIDELVAEPWGQVSPSVYETGRLVTLAPWLTRHQRRVEFLLDSQRADGGWGAPGGYALVPTLSATEALLATLTRSSVPVSDSGALDHNSSRLADAADAGLRMLARMLANYTASSLPDLPATDLIVPALIDSINQRLETLNAPEGALTGPGPAARAMQLRVPRGMDGRRLAMVRSAVESGLDLPEKVLHALEVAGDLARGAPGVRVETSGAVGASPAATAAWLDGELANRAHPARIFLESVVNGHDGLAPCGIPITVFERSWVLSGLARAGITLQTPAELVKDLHSALGPMGAAAAAGLPADSDTTSVTLYTLGLLGKPHPPDVLLEYETDGGFCTWPGEQGFSVSVNAHILDAFGHYLTHALASDSSAMSRYAHIIDRLVTILCEHQRPDGSWLDRWHASPYYATLSCVLALDEFGGARAAAAVHRARRWLRDTQRADGSWGLWDGTMEETAYALQVLLLAGGTPEEVHEPATRGYGFLLRSTSGSVRDAIAAPSLWHDKDLYLPRAIVGSAVLAALHLAEQRLSRPEPG